MTQPRRMKSIVAMVILETDDPLLDPDHVDVSTVAKVAALRQAVIDNLPKLTRVVAVYHEDTARLMCEAHDTAMRAIGEMNARPPPEYRAMMKEGRRKRRRTH